MTNRPGLSHDEREVADLLAEWRKTCRLMGMAYSDIDAAKFIVSAGFTRPSPDAEVSA